MRPFERFVFIALSILLLVSFLGGPELLSRVGLGFLGRWGAAALWSGFLIARSVRGSPYRHWAKKWRPELALAVALGLSLLLRWPMGELDLAHYIGPDEGEMVENGLAMLGAGDFNQRHPGYPGLFFYIQMVPAAAHHLLSAARGEGKTIPEQPREGFYRVARRTTLLAGWLTAIAVYLVGRRRYGRPTAALAAALVGLSPLVFRESRVVNPDLMLMLFVTIGLGFCLRVLERPKTSSFLLAGAGVGLAAAVKYTGVVLSVPYLVAWLVCGEARRSFGSACLGLLVALVTFMAASPYSWLDLPTFLRGMTMHFGYYQAADLKIRPGHVDAVDEFARGVREAVGADPVARKMLSQADVPTGQINLETSLLTADDELTRLSAVASTADDAAADAAALTAAGTRNPISEQLNDLLGLVGDARLTPEQQVARIRSAPAPDGSVWEAKRRQSLTTAIDEYNLNFPVNDNRNALNATMKFFIPFWQYESHRLFYIPRIALRNPGILHTWGLYSDNTDRGYVPIPGTGLQGNFLRNTIGMGGFSRAVNRDFPEFYDQFPGLSNTVDQAGRLGFFPNIYGSAFLASKFSNRAGVWQTGEIIPPPVGTVFEVINAIDPDNPFTDALSELFLPNRFRDYLISINVAKSMDEGQGPRASELLFKKIRGEAFTDEENAIWSTGERAASIHMIWNYQGGFTRFRPEQLDAARRLSKEIILRYVPITSEQYDEAHKLGMPIEQYYPFPRELDQELREIEAIARWRGLTSGLRPSALVEMQAKQDDFYARITEAADAKKQQELIEEERFRRTGTGHISRDELYRRKRELDSNFQQFREDLELSPEFKDVPIQYQDRIDFANEHDVQAPVRDPFSELLAFYYQVTPDDFVFFDPEVGQEVIDWNGFYTWRTGIEDSLQGQARTDFLNLVTAQDTELDAFRRADYETFIRPYKAIFQVILDQHNPQEQAIIRQFYASNRDTVSPTQRQALRDIQVGGVNLISSFQSEVSAKRRVLRRVSPELDARLAFWGETSTVTSPQAVAIHDGLFTQYDIDARTLVEIETVEPILQDLTGITE